MTVTPVRVVAPDVSVVICTYSLDQFDGLKRAVLSALAQEHAVREVIVVVDHNPQLLERAASMTRRSHEAISSRPVVLVAANKGATGLSGARNTGVGLASSEIVAFLDDDAVADVDWIGFLLSHYADPGVVACGGSVAPVITGSRPDWWPLEYDWVIGCSYLGLPTTTAQVRNLIGANMSIRRDAILRVGGFAEDIGRLGSIPTGDEETDLCIRLVKQQPDASIVYEPAARVRHTVRPERLSWSYFRSRCFAEGSSKAKVAARVGTDRALASERSYVLRVLSRGMANALFDACRGRKGAAGRAVAIATGFALTVTGFLLGRMRPPRRTLRKGETPEHRALVPIPILCYHSVSDRPDGDIAPFTVRPQEFARHLDAIAERDMTSLTISELVDTIDAGRPLPARPVVITFDDGFLDTLTVAAPMLAARGLVATVYVTTGSLPGCPGSERTRTSMIPYDRLASLEAIGLEVGAHTHSHPELDVLSNAAARDEIVRSKGLLELALSHRVRSFAYPHGYASRRIRDAVRAAGFDSACGVRDAFSHEGDDRFSRARLTVLSTTSVAEIGRWLDGTGAPIAGPREKMRTKGWRIVRRLRALSSRTPRGDLERSPPQLRTGQIAGSSTSPSATIVVTTCGGSRNSLEETVRSALGQDYERFDVVVVDNRPADSGVEAALASAFDGDRALRYVAEPRRGLSHARNRGARFARGEIVAFTDDDVQIESGWLRALISGFGDPSVVCVTGLILPIEVRTDAQKLFEEFGGFGKGTTRRKWDPRTAHERSALFPYAVGAYGSGANAAFRRNELLALGGFDASLGAGTAARGGEDLDIFVRCMQRGHCLVYEPRAIVHHAHHEEMDDLRLQIRDYGVGLGAMLTKQLLSNPGAMLALLARLPAGLSHLLSSRSPKNASRSDHYPRSLVLTELAGIAYGPVAYLRSRTSP